MHYFGHYPGHFGALVRSLAQGLLGFDFDYLWLGNRASIERPLVLTSINGATEDNTPTGYNPSAWNRGLFRYPAAGASWRGPLPNFSENFLAVVVFRAQGPIGVQANLASKREGSPNFLGWEFFLDGSGRLTVTVDSDVSAAQILGTPTDLVTSQLPQVVALRFRSGLLEVASVIDSVQLALNPGSFASAADFSIGAGRLATSTQLEIGFVGLVLDRPTHLVQPDLQQGVVWPVATELTVSEVLGSEVIDANQARVYAWNPDYL